MRVLSGGEPWRGGGGVDKESVDKEPKSVVAKNAEKARVSPATRESHVVSTCASPPITSPTVLTSPFHLHRTHAQTRTPHSCSHHSQDVRKDVGTHIPRIHPRQSGGSQREHCRCPVRCRSRCRCRRQGMHRDARCTTDCCCMC